MNNRSLKPVWVLLAIIVFVMTLYGIAASRSAKEAVIWRTDLARARDEAREKKKLVFLEFSAEWCGPCQSLKRSLWSDPRVAAAIDARCIPVSIDIDQRRDLAERYRITSIPRMLIEDADGKMLQSREGALSREEFLGWIASVH